MTAIRVVDNHIELGNIGMNTHAQIDSHIADPNAHHNDVHTLNHHSTPYELDNDLTLDKNLYLGTTAHANLKGIIYKNSIPFIHTFSYGFNGITTPDGKNMFIGEDAGNFTTGATATTSIHSSYNIGIGHDVLGNITTGNFNIGIGTYSAASLTTGYRNTAIGYASLWQPTTCRDNTAIGERSMMLTTTGVENTAIGTRSLYSNTTGYQNTAVGYYALHDNNIGYRNTAVGYSALDWNCSGYDNVGIGWQALRKNVNGYYNTGIGTDALYSNWSGDLNTGIGWGTLYNNSGGNDNTAIGMAALYKCNGNENLGIGANVLFELTTGEGNMAMGSRALYELRTGSENIGLGSRAGVETAVGNNTTAEKCIFIGARTKALADGDEEEIVIGDRATGKGSNTTQIGNTHTTDTYIEGTLNISDIYLTPGTAPGTPVEGDLYMDSTTHKLRCHDGTIWQNCF